MPITGDLAPSAGQNSARRASDDQRVGRTFARKLYPADSAFAAPHAADRTSCVTSRRDVLVKRRPRDADRLAVSSIVCFFCRYRWTAGTGERHGTLFLTELFSPAAFPAACTRGRQPRVRSFADQVPLKLCEPQKCETPACRPVWSCRWIRSRKGKENPGLICSPSVELRHPLLKSIDASKPFGLQDRAVLAVLSFAGVGAARIGPARARFQMPFRVFMMQARQVCCRITIRSQFPRCTIALPKLSK